MNQEHLKMPGQEFRNKILCGMLYVAVTFFVIEIVVYILLLVSGHDFSVDNIYGKVLKLEEDVPHVGMYIFGYILLPSGINLSAFAIANARNKKIGLSDVKKSLAILIAIQVQCLVVCTIHSYFLFTPAIFVSVLFVASMMNNKRLFRHAFCSSSTFMIVSIFAATLFDNTWKISERLSYFVVCYIIFVAFAILCNKIKNFFLS